MQSEEEHELALRVAGITRQLSAALMAQQALTMAMIKHWGDPPHDLRVGIETLRKAFMQHPASAEETAAIEKAFQMALDQISDL